MGAYLNPEGSPQAKNVIVMESTAPKPVCVAAALAPEDEALKEALKKPGSGTVGLLLSGMSPEEIEDAKGKGKNKGMPMPRSVQSSDFYEGKTRKGPEPPGGGQGKGGAVKRGAGVPLGLAMIIKRQRQQEAEAPSFQSW